MLGMVVWGTLLGMSGLRGCWLGIIDIFLDPFVEYGRGLMLDRPWQLYLLLCLSVFMPVKVTNGVYGGVVVVVL